MTKKDGVDVNECDFFIKNRDKYLCRCTKINSFGDIVNPKNAENSNCLDNYNCYYKQLARKTQELKSLKNNEDLLISNLQILWGKQIAEEQGDCKNIDYSKPRTREIYLKISEIEQTLKDVAFAQSVKLGKTKPLGDTGSPRSYKRWEKRERQLLEREILK